MAITTLKKKKQERNSGSKKKEMRFEEKSEKVDYAKTVI